jgi:drug/metabolite transporter (DMT)-like permease
MSLLFIGLTFLIAHVFFFSAHDLGWFIKHIYEGAGLPMIALRYLSAVCLVAIFFYFTKLPQRLAKPIAGRRFLLAGVTLYCLQAFVLYGGLAGYRPGLAMLMWLSMYAATIAIGLILVGAGLALLGASQAPN